MRAARRYALILAGGDGRRLQPLTRLISGDDRPKQFCPISDGETLLERTRRRVALAVPASRTAIVVTEAHERFYAPMLAERPTSWLVTQPSNRGTAPGILAGLRAIAARDALAAVAIVPCDHHVGDDARFMAHVTSAFELVERRPDLVALLGASPSDPEPDYGWIELGPPVDFGFRRIRRFVEKPDPAAARRLMTQGGLWNTFVIVAGVPALLALVRKAVPALATSFAAASDLRALYRELPSAGFSETVLATNPANLVVRVVDDVEWSDWGRPSRVLRTLDRLDRKPAWAERATALVG
jgi:mannose-1-phosphate guanylyltransferase